MNSQYLDQVEKYSTVRLTNLLSQKMVFHDITYTHRLIDAIKTIAQSEQISPQETETLLMAGWLVNLGFTDADAISNVGAPEDLFAACYECSIDMGTKYLDEIGFPPERAAQVIALIQEVQPEQEDISPLGMILSDAMTSDWGQPKSKSKIKNLYEEFLLTGAVSYGKGTWYDTVLSYLREHQYYTNYGRTVLEKGKLNLLKKIEKEKKDLDKEASIIIQKELKIGNEELKKLKKSLSSVTGRDDRGIQTLFRTTSRNHYTMNQMMDRKANIMISINAILLSLIISRTIGQIDTFCIHNSPILMILLSSIASMIFAVLAIIPFKTQGTFTEYEIREKKGNLLYYGNFHNMNFRDFEWGMLEMLSDGDYIYSTMIRDLYFLGETLHKKSKLIRLSLSLFILGLVLSTVLFMMVSSMDDYHLGSAAHI